LSNEIGYAEPVAGEQFTVTNSAVGFNSAILAQTSFTKVSEALVVVNTNAVRIRVDGTAPTTTVGMKLSAGMSIVIYLASLKKFSMIRDGAADAEVFVTYSSNQTTTGA
jgi:hypothetical protein